jgi:hypothetical protein
VKTAAVTVYVEGYLPAMCKVLEILQTDIPFDYHFLRRIY